MTSAGVQLRKLRAIYRDVYFYRHIRNVVLLFSAREAAEDAQQHKNKHPSVHIKSLLFQTVLKSGRRFQRKGGGLLSDI